jgi:hypothetical protein
LGVNVGVVHGLGFETDFLDVNGDVVHGRGSRIFTFWWSAVV